MTNASGRLTPCESFLHCCLNRFRDRILNATGSRPRRADGGVRVDRLPLGSELGSLVPAWCQNYPGSLETT